jgi:hypothetical protein
MPLADRAEPRIERTPPASVEQALERARRHGRAAIVEALEAARALLDALALGLTGEPADARRGLGALTQLLEGLAERFDQGASEAAAPIVQALAEALDAEISRWEKRAHEDTEARAVLRAFLGLRELLWEIGVRPSPGASDARPTRDKPGPKRAGRRSRLQRVRVEGEGESGGMS